MKEGILAYNRVNDRYGLLSSDLWGTHRISLWEKNGSIYGWKMDSQQNGNESEKRVVSGRNSVQRKSGVYSCENRRIKPVKK